MIVAGILKGTSSKTHPYSVSILTGDKEKTNHSVTFFLGNDNKVPYHIKQAVDCGEAVAIIVEVELADQFAYYCNEDGIVH